MLGHNNKKPYMLRPASLLQQARLTADLIIKLYNEPEFPGKANALRFHIAILSSQLRSLIKIK